jgi:hypothetical protein
MSEYLYFEETWPSDKKTAIIYVRSKSSSDVLGEIRWYGPWRQYTFWPSGETIFNKGCMLDILGVIDNLMEARRSG